jgi:hypothetical protein
MQSSARGARALVHVARVAVQVVACVSLAAAPLAAQRTDSLVVGMRVRLETSDRTPPWVIGTWEGRTPGDSLRIRTDGGALVTVAPERILSAARSARQYDRSQAITRGVRRGFTYVGLASLMALAVVGAYELQAPRSDFRGIGTIAVGVVGFAATVTATVVGGIVGAGHRDDWRTAPVPTR